MSASASNSRSNQMPPPASTLPTKRKTLVEKGGEPNRPAPGTRSINAGFKYNGITGSYRETSSVTSISSLRPPSTTSTRNASFSNSVGAGGRLPSLRPQSAASNSRSQKPSSVQHRPSTSLDVCHTTNRVNQGVGEITGMAPFSSISPENLKLGGQDINKSYETHMNQKSDWASRSYPAKSIRDFSLSTLFSQLSIYSKPQPTPKVELEPLLTPSRIPIQSPRVSSVASPLESISPCKSSKKPKNLAPFLTRDSNTRAAAPGFDAQSRLENVENMYHNLQVQISEATSESGDLKKLNSEFKIRSKWNTFFS